MKFCKKKPDRKEREDKKGEGIDKMSVSQMLATVRNKARYALSSRFEGIESMPYATRLAGQIVDSIDSMSIQELESVVQGFVRERMPVSSELRGALEVKINTNIGFVREVKGFIAGFMFEDREEKTLSANLIISLQEEGLSISEKEKQRVKSLMKEVTERIAPSFRAIYDRENTKEAKLLNGLCEAVNRAVYGADEAFDLQHLKRIFLEFLKKILERDEIKSFELYYSEDLSQELKVNECFWILAQDSNRRLVLSLDPQEIGRKTGRSTVQHWMVYDQNIIELLRPAFEILLQRKADGRLDAESQPSVILRETTDVAFQAPEEDSRRVAAALAPTEQVEVDNLLPPAETGTTAVDGEAETLPGQKPQE